MDCSKPHPIEKDFRYLRKHRQDNNDNIVYECLINGDIEKFNANINRKQYDRTLSKFKLLETEFLLECKQNNMIAQLTSMLISKKASRQGSNDETEQLKICNMTAEKCGCKIKNLSNTEIRPTKDGSIVSNDKMKKKGIQKDCCLKSFDGQLSGKINGFISAKVAYGSGGHQDNVFEELDTLAEWWKKYKSGSEELLVILIDTDLIQKITRIKEKYNNVDNIMVFIYNFNNI